jgi:error-prone DNA polymerase
MVFGFAPPDVEASGLPAMGAAEKVRNEVERLGMDITHHMLEFYAPFLNAIGAVKSSDLLSLRSQSEVLVAGIKVAMQTPPVRSGRRVIFSMMVMAVLTPHFSLTPKRVLLPLSTVHPYC